MWRPARWEPAPAPAPMTPPTPAAVAAPLLGLCAGIYEGGAPLLVLAAITVYTLGWALLRNPRRSAHGGSHASKALPQAPKTAPVDARGTSAADETPPDEWAWAAEARAASRQALSGYWRCASTENSEALLAACRAPRFAIWLARKGGFGAGSVVEKLAVDMRTGALHLLQSRPAAKVRYVLGMRGVGEKQRQYDLLMGRTEPVVTSWWEGGAAVYATCVPTAPDLVITSWGWVDTCGRRQVRNCLARRVGGRAGALEHILVQSKVFERIRDERFIARWRDPQI